MKNFRTLIYTFLVVVLMMPLAVKAQDGTEPLASVDAGVDVYSSYIWRGAKFGSGPAFQPWVEGTVGGLAIGAWGSVNAGSDEAMEMDLYLGYSFDFGLSLGVTDYYFGMADPEDSTGSTMVPGGFFDYESNHFIEPAIGFEVGNFSALFAYMFAPDFSDGDIYLEAAYSFGGVLDVTIGAGDGAYTDDGDFMLCNISLGTSKEIKITDSYSLPISGGVTLNPSTEGFFIYAGISF